jgi:hypothetical protein
VNGRKPRTLPGSQDDKIQVAHVRIEMHPLVALACRVRFTRPGLGQGIGACWNTVAEYQAPLRLSSRLKTLMRSCAILRDFVRILSRANFSTERRSAATHYERRTAEHLPGRGADLKWFGCDENMPLQTGRDEPPDWSLLNGCVIGLERFVQLVRLALKHRRQWRATTGHE